MTTNFQSKFVQSQTELRTLYTQLAQTTDPAAEPERARLLASCQQILRDVSVAFRRDGAGLPMRDRATYDRAIKDLTIELQKARKASTPKRKFEFVLGHVPDQVQGQGLSLGKDSDAIPESRRKDIAVVARATETEEGGSTGGPVISNVSSRVYIHLAGPRASESKSDKTGNESSMTSLTITGVTRSVIVIPANQGSGAAEHSVDNPPLSTLKVKDTTASLLLLTAPIAGSVHVTSVSHSTIIIPDTRQVRLHDCTDCVVCLRCWSRPIIERCSGMRFTCIPDDRWVVRSEDSSGGAGGAADGVGKSNMWNQVDDFQWLRMGQSPNWQVLKERDDGAGAVRDDAGWKMLEEQSAGDIVDNLDTFLHIVRR